LSVDRPNLEAAGVVRFESIRDSSNFRTAASTLAKGRFSVNFILGYRFRELT
jgi:hypothetical protein